MQHKSITKSASTKGFKALNHWTKKEILKELIQYISSLSKTNKEDFLLITSLLSKAYIPLNTLIKEINKLYTHEELIKELLEPKGVFRTGKYLKHTTFYFFKPSKYIVKFIYNMYRPPIPVQLKLKLNLKPFILL